MGVANMPLMPEQMRDMKDCFTLFDTDGNGSIDQTELKVAVRALGLDPSNDALKNVIGLIDKDPKSGGIDFNEFVNLMTISMDKTSDKAIMEMFMLFDSDNTGKITFKNIKAMAKELGENLTDEELQDLLDEGDRDGDGHLSMDEFMALMKGPQHH